MNTMRRFIIGAAAVALVAGSAACDTGGRRKVTANAVTAGQVNLTFSGAFQGRAEGVAEVACFEPVEEGDKFTVSIDSKEGLPLAGASSPDGNVARFLALDVALADYDGPGDYELEHVRADEDVDRSDFFLLFDTDPDPYEWGVDGASGTLTVEKGVASGKVALKGWKNVDGDVADVTGTFVCGGAPTP